MSVMEMSEMSVIDRLIATVEGLGLRIRAGSQPGELMLSGDKNEITPDLMELLKLYKPQLLERYGSKPVPQDSTRSD